MFRTGTYFFGSQFKSKEYRGLIFRTGPYFFGSRGMYLTRWMSDFNRSRTSHQQYQHGFTLHIFLFIPGKDSLRSIGNALGRFIEKLELKDGLFTCAGICVEVDLEKKDF